MAVTLDLDAIALALPAGYRPRPFREEDREPLTAEHNAEVPEVEQETAAEWREWEQSAPDPTLVRVVVESVTNGIAAMLSVGNGGPFRAPDGSAHGGVQVSRTHRGRGIGTGLLPIVEAEAPPPRAPPARG